MPPRIRAHVRLLIGATVAMLLAAPAMSSGAVTCVSNAQDLEVTVDSAGLRIVRSGLDIDVMAGANVVACTGGQATVANTDAIVVIDTAPPNFAYSDTIDLSGGRFEPGATNETGTSDEIEFGFQGAKKVEFTGTGAVDNMRFGVNGGIVSANLNAGDETSILAPGRDVDATFDTTTRIGVNAGGSSDIVGGQGGLATGSPFQSPMTLFGGASGDQLTGGDGDDSIGYLGLSSDEQGDDTLAGGAGADQLAATPGDDQLTGGAGVDRITYFNALSSVTVDLAISGQQATGGGGLDTISGVESVYGGLSNDTLSGDEGANTIEGGLAADTLDGRGGVDTLVGDAAVGPFGSDVLMIRDGGPDTATCGPEADSVTADQLGVDTIDSSCETIDFATAPDPGPDPDPDPDPDPGGDVEVELSARQTQRVLKKERLVAFATCPQVDCAATATASIKLPKHRAAAKRVVRLRPATAALDAGKRAKLKLALTRRKARVLARPCLGAALFAAGSTSPSPMPAARRGRRAPGSRWCARAWRPRSRRRRADVG